MEPTYLSWTPTNWVTVFLMAAGGFIIFKLAISAVKAAKNKGQ